MRGWGRNYKYFHRICFCIIWITLDRPICIPVLKNGLGDLEENRDGPRDGDDVPKKENMTKMIKRTSSFKYIQKSVWVKWHSKLQEILVVWGNSNFDSNKSPYRCNKFLQFITLMFIYSSICLGLPRAHHQELNNCSNNLWFYLRIVVIAVLLFVFSPKTNNSMAITTIRR